MNMKKSTLLLCLLVITKMLTAQVSSTFSIGGDLNKFYPVTFFDGGWENNVATVLDIAQPYVNEGGSLRGALIASFRYHVTNWGNGAAFIDADIRQFTGVNPQFIAGWRDATFANSNLVIIIWLRGNSNYRYHSNYAVNPKVYDGVQNPLPYQEPVSSTSSFDHSYKTAVDPYVNSSGITYANSAYFNGSASNYFGGKVGIGAINPIAPLHSAAYDNTSTTAAYLWGEHYGTVVAVANTSPSYYAFHVSANLDSAGVQKSGGPRSLLYVRADGNVGIGTTNPQAKLAVNGDVLARRVRVSQGLGDWPDYVFAPGYELPSLLDVEKYIKNNQHLPEIPSAAEVEKGGLDVGEMNKQLLKKVEELTLYLIDMRKEINQLKSQNEELDKQARGSTCK
jgi:hypothetical protein